MLIVIVVIDDLTPVTGGDSVCIVLTGKQVIVLVVIYGQQFNRPQPESERDTGYEQDRQDTEPALRPIHGV
jgi:hypothetical protein